MANNTETYWEADGQSLHTYARSIETLGGMGPPPFRGEDITVPLSPGQIWVPKVLDSNILTLAMWLRGVSQEAGSGVTATTKAQYQSNWNDLIRLLWTPGRQVSLRKRFYDGGVLRLATALAEYQGGLQPSLIGNSAARCTVDMKIAAGVFYHDTETSVVLSNGNNNVTVLGNAPTGLVKVEIVGARTNVKVRNNTAGVEFTYPQVLNTGVSAIIDSSQYLVTDQSHPAKNMAPLIIHSGSAQWMYLTPGVNVINLSSTAGAGVVTLKYRAAWV